MPASCTRSKQYNRSYIIFYIIACYGKVFNIPTGEMVIGICWTQVYTELNTGCPMSLRQA